MAAQVSSRLVSIDNIVGSFDIAYALYLDLYFLVLSRQHSRGSLFCACEKSEIEKHALQAHLYSRHSLYVLYSNLAPSLKDVSPELGQHRYRFLSSFGNTSLPTARNLGTRRALMSEVQWGYEEGVWINAYSVK